MDYITEKLFFLIYLMAICAIFAGIGILWYAAYTSGNIFFWFIAIIISFMALIIKRCLHLN